MIDAGELTNWEEIFLAQLEEAKCDIQFGYLRSAKIELNDAIGILDKILNEKQTTRRKKHEINSI